MTKASSGFDVSVLIPVHDRERALGRAIESCLNQSEPVFEVLVVDDGSTDASATVAESYGHPVRLLRQSNSGPSAARNTAITEASGSWLAFLDSDDEWDTDKIARQSELARRYPDVGLIHTDARYYLDAKLASKSMFRRYGHDRAMLRERVEKGLAGLLRKNFIVTSSVLAKAEVVRAVGGFDVSLWNAEDRDLWLRVAATCPIGCINRPLVSKYEGDGADNLNYNLERRGRMMLEVLSRWKRKEAVVQSPELRHALRFGESRGHNILGSALFKAKRYREARAHFNASFVSEWNSPRFWGKWALSTVLARPLDTLSE